MIRPSMDNQQAAWEVRDFLNAMLELGWVVQGAAGGDVVVQPADADNERPGANAYRLRKQQTDGRWWAEITSRASVS